MWFFSLDNDPFFDFNSNLPFSRNNYFLFFNFRSKTYYSLFNNLQDLFLYFFKFLCKFELGRTIVVFVPNLSEQGYPLISYLFESKIKYSVLSSSFEFLSISFSYNATSFIFRCSSKIYYPFSTSLFLLQNSFFFFEFLNKFLFVNTNALTLFCSAPSSFVQFFSSDILLRYLNIFYAYFSSLNLFFLFFIKFFGIFSILSNLSLSSLAKYIFLYYYNFNNIDLNPSVSEISYVSDSYYGGRSEVFGNSLDGELIYYYDYNSMYGQCMQEYFHSGKSFLSCPNEVKTPGFYTIDWFCAENLVPVLPSRCPVTNEVFYLTGGHSGVYWFEEILLALDQGYFIKKIHHARLYPNFAQVFIHFTNFFLTLREKGSCWKILGKLIINNFYGSLSLKKKLSNLSVFTSSLAFNDFISSDNVFHYICFDNKYFVFYYSFQKDQYAKNTNVSYASAISSKARIKLFSSFTKIFLEGGRLLMCDVDSVYAAYSSSYQISSLSSFKWLKIYRDGLFLSPNSFVLQTFGLLLEGRMSGKVLKTLDFSLLKSDFYSKSSHYFSFNSYRKRIFSLNKKFSTPLFSFPK